MTSVAQAAAKLGEQTNNFLPLTRRRSYFIIYTYICVYDIQNQVQRTNSLSSSSFLSKQSQACFSLCYSGSGVIYVQFYSQESTVAENREVSVACETPRTAHRIKRDLGTYSYMTLCQSPRFFNPLEQQPHDFIIYVRLSCAGRISLKDGTDMFFLAFWKHDHSSWFSFFFLLFIEHFIAWCGNLFFQSSKN